MKTNRFIFNLGIFLICFFTFSSIMATAPSNVTSPATSDQVLSAIAESNSIINEMIKNNFSVVYMKDLLIEANLTFKQVGYAEVLRNDSSTSQQQNEARAALSLTDWKNLSYSNVLNYTDEIKSRRNRAFEISDNLLLNQISIDRYMKKRIVLNDSQNLLDQAKIAFYADRYDEADALLKQTRASIDSSSSELSLINTLKDTLTGFIQKYWIGILIFLIILYFISKYTIRKVSISKLKQKIAKMNSEFKAIDKLIKMTQTERFKENKISSLVYNIRMKKYNERVEEIKQDLPVLEARLRRIVAN